MPTIPALRRLKQDSRVQGQPGLQSETHLKKKKKIAAIHNKELSVPKCQEPRLR
jgi:hypothetical protein